MQVRCHSRDEVPVVYPLVALMGKISLNFLTVHKIQVFREDQQFNNLSIKRPSYGIKRIGRSSLGTRTHEFAVNPEILSGHRKFHHANIPDICWLNRMKYSGCLDCKKARKTHFHWWLLNHPQIFGSLKNILPSQQKYYGRFSNWTL